MSSLFKKRIKCTFHLCWLSPAFGWSAGLLLFNNVKIYWEKDLQRDIQKNGNLWNWGKLPQLEGGHASWVQAPREVLKEASWGQALGLMILEVFGCQHLEVVTQLMTTCLTLTESILLANDAQPYLHNRLTHCSTQSGDWLLAEYQQSSEQGRLSQPSCLLAGAGWPPQYVHYEIISSSFNHAMEIPLSRSSKPCETFSYYLEPFTQFSSLSVCLNWSQLLKESTLRNYESNKIILYTYRELPPKDD